MFPQQLISYHSDINWPHHSPEFSAADFYHVGLPKDKVYETSPVSITDLKQCIGEYIEAIPISCCSV
jgi:hypothetical protein